MVTMKHILTIAIVFSTLMLSAHPGGIDARGGHYNRKTGEYHYHNTSATINTVNAKSVSPATTTTTPRIESTNIKHPESWYVTKLQEQMGGKEEVKCPYGRVDLVTSKLVIEVDFLDKFKEAIGQALWYSWNGRKTPCIGLIVGQDKVKKYTYVRDTIKKNISRVTVIDVSRETGMIFDK